jgi:hypothetical protein
MGDFFWYLWMGITQSMALNPQVAQFVDRYPRSGWVVLTIAILGGAGLLLGQSVIMFVNRVRPGRFLLTLLLNGIVFTISLLIWALAIWAIGSLAFPTQPSLGLVTRLVGLSAAPYVFGLFVLVPYLGEAIYRGLSIWSSLIAAGATAYSFQVGWWPAFLVVGASWLLIWALSNTIGRPVVALRNRVWQRAAGTSLDASVADILTQFATGTAEGEQRGGPKP